MKDVPRITFGIIVLNGEPFTRYNLRALYPFAHQIIVAEGASPSAAQTATPDGHSCDGTLDILRHFKAEEDPEDKIVIVTAEDEGHPNGFWPGEKHEQSQAYAKRATGDWLWQIDVDEFYLSEDMSWICNSLLSKQEIHTISFKQFQFWGGIDYYADGWFLRHYFSEIHRVFRWKKSYTYTTHRPPSVIDEKGNDLRDLGWISGRDLAAKGMYLYHYSLVFPNQIQAKSAYYSAVDWGQFSQMTEWANRNYENLENPYRVHNTYQYPSWLEHYDGIHPLQVQKMWSDIQHNRLETTIQLRHVDDIEYLLNSISYRLGKQFLKIIGPVLYSIEQLAIRIVHTLPQSLQWHLKKAVRRMFYETNA